jgi:SAM-dependent methyltransferase
MDVSEYGNIKDYEESHWWYISAHRAVLRVLDALPGRAKVLDAGCGTGGLINFLGSRSKFSIAGFDASLIALGAASQEVAIPGRVIQAVIEAIPTKDGTFDAVTCIDVIYHQDVHGEKKALAEMGHVLKPGGYLILQVPAFEFLRGGHDEVVHTRRRYTVKEIRRLLTGSGFKVISLRYRHPWLFLPALVIRRFSRGKAESDLKPVSPIMNLALLSISRFFDRSFFGVIPFGTSVFAVARKA